MLSDLRKCLTHLGEHSEIIWHLTCVVIGRPRRFQDTSEPVWRLNEALRIDRAGCCEWCVVHKASGGEKDDAIDHIREHIRKVNDNWPAHRQTTKRGSCKADVVHEECEGGSVEGT